MAIHFTKMQGLGNDFVIVEADKLPPDIDLAHLAAYAGDRHFGVGSDGLIVVAPPTDRERYDLQFIFYNSDGSRAEMCGNGIRCFARYVYDRGIFSGRQMRVETLAGLMQPKLNDDGTVTVDMGPPILAPERIPFAGPGQTAPVLNYPLEVLDTVVPVTPVSMGNPHCMIFQDDLAQPLDPVIYGPAIEKHPLFPAKTNVEFLEILDSRTIKVVVWERGCGFTLACGTGACASAVAAMLQGKAGSEVEIILPGGSLMISWDREANGSVFMTGPAEYVFEGDLTHYRAENRAAGVNLSVS
jgi:diaminopimelate epimerase